MKSIIKQYKLTITGRPPIFSDKKTLQKKISDYWNYCGITEMASIKGKKVKNIPTINGLALWLGTNRQTLSNYEKREEFFYTIKRAKMVIEAFNEQMLISGEIDPRIVIFNLKNNFGWKDKVETEDNIININVEELCNNFDFLMVDKK